jgi:hypothetical protein
MAVASPGVGRGCQAGVPAVADAEAFGSESTVTVIIDYLRIV